MYFILNRSEKFAFGSYEQVDRLSDHHKRLIVAGEIKVFKCGDQVPGEGNHWVAFYEYKPVSDDKGGFKEGGTLHEVKRLEVNDGPT